jgi:regulator of sigma E protease
VAYRLSHWTEAFTMVNTTSYNMVVKSLQLIPRFFRSAEQGGINPNKSLTGPIGIFSQLKVRAEHFGIRSYLKFLALIGLNLFLVNLLPIPITDGGQLVFLGIETAIGRPLPPALRNAFQWAGVILVVGLMLYVLGLDISRLLPG